MAKVAEPVQKQEEQDETSSPSRNQCSANKTTIPGAKVKTYYWKLPGGGVHAIDVPMIDSSSLPNQVTLVND